MWIPLPSVQFLGYAYYGEYPLAFAACLGNKDIYDYLLDHGANPDLQDSFGNTVLHMVVISDQSVSSWHHILDLTSCTKINRNGVNSKGFQPSWEAWLVIEQDTRGNGGIHNSTVADTLACRFMGFLPDHDRV